MRRFAGRMHVEADRLAALVQEIVDLSRLQVADSAARAGARRHRPGRRRGRRPGAGRRPTASGSSLDVVAASDGPVYGDHDLLAPPCATWSTTRSRYSEEGTRIGIGARRDGDLVEIAVADQGVGIPAAEQERVFERFYRVDPARSRATGGTGLGLSIVKHVAANHGGEVTVWSQAGRGSTFTLRLPARGRPAAASAPTTAAPTAECGTAEEEHGMTRILVVEDEVVVLGPAVLPAARRGTRSRSRPTGTPRSTSSTAAAPTSCCST